MNKKSQMPTQIFIYIMVLIVGLGILIYGYNAVKGFKEQADDVLYLQFENGLRHDLKSISFESVRTKVYDLPAAVDQICFKGPDAKYADVILEQDRQSDLGKNYKYPLIASAVKADIENNVFIYPKGERAFYTGVVIDFGENDQTGQPKQFKCFDVKASVFKIKIRGQGTSVLITEP